jgi:hypothetical protein
MVERSSERRFAGRATLIGVSDGSLQPAPVAVLGCLRAPSSSASWVEKRKHLGQHYAHAAVDDHSRLAFSALMAMSAHRLCCSSPSTPWPYARHGIAVRAILTDNASRYTHNRALRDPLSREGITPHHPSLPGAHQRKVRRFHQPMAREWRYGLSYASSAHREHALPHSLKYYNQLRPPSGIENRPPISRDHNLCAQDS